MCAIKTRIEMYIYFIVTRFSGQRSISTQTQLIIVQQNKSRVRYCNVILFVWITITVN